MSNVATITLSSSKDMNDDYTYFYGFLFLDASSGNMDIDLTDQGIGYGVFYEFYRIDSSTNTCTINAKTGYTINGNASITLSNGQYLKLIDNGTNWIPIRIQTI